MVRPLHILTGATLGCLLPISTLSFGLDAGHLLHPATTFVSTHHHNPEFLATVVQHQLRGIQQAYTNSLHDHPLVTKMLTGGTLAASGDAIAQRRTGEPYDKRRAVSFLTFDMAYRALQHVLFPIIIAQCHGQFLSEILPHAALDHVPTEYLAAMEQTLASQLGIVPFVYYPIFFALTGSLQGLTPEASWSRAQENFVGLMKRNLLFWIPIQFIQFGFIEEQLQIPFLSAAGLCWTFILSMVAGSAKSYSTPIPQIQVEGESNAIAINNDESVTVKNGDKAAAVA